MFELASIEACLDNPNRIVERLGIDIRYRRPRTVDERESWKTELGHSREVGYSVWIPLQYWDFAADSYRR